MNDAFGSKLNIGDTVFISVNNIPSYAICLGEILELKENICSVQIIKVPNDSDISSNEIRTICDSRKLVKR